MQVADHGADSLAFYSVVRKTYQACTQSLRDFFGKQNMQQFSSDNAPELIKAVEELMVPHAASTPHRSSSNRRIENVIGQVLMGSRALLHQSGLPTTWW
eukprot:3016285-Heterocapsa_arctica.AAC.1